jgi:hypothetical protein
MSTPFNPLAGDFTTTGWVAPIDDYELKIVKVNYRMVGNDNPKPVLSFDLAINAGPFLNKRPPAFQVWEPETDFSSAGRVIMAALGYTPGKEDARFASENADMDLTLDSTQSPPVLGDGYARLEGCVFRASLGQNAKPERTYQTFKNIRPLNG